MKKILLIHTGGTLGMEPQSKRTLESGMFVEGLLQYVPEIKQLAELEMLRPFTLDSADVGIPEWQQLGQILSDNIDKHDGFVIIHGTDTMSYTASALSFMLSNLPKPVIITGSQRPIAAIHTDARNNLTHAIKLATFPIQEVCLYFREQLFRGNRTKKVSIDNFDAFQSPNFPPLARVGLHIEKVKSSRKATGLFQLETNFDDRVLAIKIFPSMNLSFWESLLQTDAQILVLEAFGAGNVPINSSLLIDVIEKMTLQKKLVIIASQCHQGTCDLKAYEGGKKAMLAGAISAKDMTFEATMVKAMFLLGRFKGDIAKVKQYFQFSIAGEIDLRRDELNSQAHFC